MQKWEYKTLVVRRADEHLLVEFLNDAGREGWEALGNGVESSYNIGFYMKRPVEAEVIHLLCFSRGSKLCENPTWTGWLVPEHEEEGVLCPKCKRVRDSRSSNA